MFVHAQTLKTIIDRDFIAIIIFVLYRFHAAFKLSSSSYTII